MANLLNEETAQLYALCGRGARASLRVLRHGLAVAEMAVSELPGNPTAVWTIRRAAADELDAYIVVSFTNATLVRAPSRPTLGVGMTHPSPFPSPKPRWCGRRAPALGAAMGALGASATCAARRGPWGVRRRSGPSGCPPLGAAACAR